MSAIAVNSCLNLKGQPVWRSNYYERQQAGLSEHSRIHLYQSAKMAGRQLSCPDSVKFLKNSNSISLRTLHGLSNKKIIGALVTLTGRLLGFLQWRKTKRSGKFLEDRENSYKSVWAALEDVHLQVRAETFSTTQFNESVKIANVLLIKNGFAH